MAVADIWAGLSPNAKRAAALAGAAALVLGLAGISTLFSPMQQDAQEGAQERLVRNLLTDADPRAMGIEGLASRVEGLEDRIDAVLIAVREAQAAPAPPPAADETALDAVSQELESLRMMHHAMQEQLERQRLTPAPAREPPPDLAPVPPRPAPAPQPPARSTQPPNLNNLFGPPTGGATTAPGIGDAVRPPAARGGTTAIRTVAAAPAPEGAPSRADDVRKPKAGEVFIPAGTILSGILLNGTDMPTGQQARQQPTPVLIRIKDLAILPNYVRTDVRECFLITSGFGDLSSERAHLRGETFSCVRADGGVIEVPLDGYAVGEDGKVGMRGRLVSKQGAMLAKALQAGFLQSFSQIFQATPAIPVANATDGGNTQFLSNVTPEAFGAGVASGTGGALNRLAEFYLDMADQMFPVIEVDAGRGVEFILNRGVALKIRS
jgi:conjugal transfer pilus assembly protein TraB